VAITSTAGRPGDGGEQNIEARARVAVGEVVEPFQSPDPSTFFRLLEV
jgi:hypothetical protein